ncbi:MAG: CBS domain-containing protein [Dehalococcoidia bacterium]
MTKVKEIITDDVQSVSPTDTIAKVAQKMADSGQRVLPVCQDGKFRGIITESDIVSHLVAKGQAPSRELAESLITNHSPKVSDGTDIVDAARIMADNGICYLPVVGKGGKFSGLLTLGDLVKESLALASIVLASRKQGELNGAGK